QRGCGFAAFAESINDCPTKPPRVGRVQANVAQPCGGQDGRAGTLRVFTSAGPAKPASSWRRLALRGARSRTPARRTNAKPAARARGGSRRPATVSLQRK